MKNKNSIHAFVAVMIALFVLASGLLAYKLTQAPLIPIGDLLPQNQSPQSEGRMFENEYLEVTVPNTWKLTEATVTLQDKTTGKEVLVGTPMAHKTGAVNVTKGNYILYINPNAGQASGITGGRFGEIAGGAPSADAVIIDHPSPPCSKGEQYSVFGSNIREDLYVSSSTTAEWCKSPAGNKTVWYFSYITDSRMGYFNYYKNGQAPAYVITMAYNGTSVDALPAKGSSELEEFLSEMTDIARTAKFKQLAAQ